MARICDILLEQSQALHELHCLDEHMRNKDHVSRLQEEIRELRSENSNLRAALELKEIELERCRAVQECEKEKAKDKRLDKNDSDSKGNRDKLEKIELQRKISNLKKESDDKDLEIRQLKSKLATAKDSFKKQSESESMKYQQEIFILQQLLKEARPGGNI